MPKQKSDKTEDTFSSKNYDLRILISAHAQAKKWQNVMLVIRQAVSSQMLFWID